MKEEKELPLVTVITVTYNLKAGRKEFFLKCVKSLQHQTYSNIEYLIVDGASSDGTLMFFNEINFPKNTTIISEPDSGMWNAMNKGIKKANGKYICFLNSDDYYVTDTIIADCVEQLEKTDSDCSIANFMAIKLNGEVVNKWCENIKPFPREFFYRRMTYNHETLICRKDIYEKLGFHDEKYKTACDYYFNIRLVLAGCQFTYVDKVMIAARAGGETVSSEGEFSNSTLTNVTNLWNDLYPECVFTPKITNEILSHQRFPPNFLERIKREIMSKQLKNFNYDVFVNDINSLIEKEKKYNNQKSILEYLKSKNIAYIILMLLTNHRKKNDPNTEERFIHYLEKHKKLGLIYLKLAKFKEKKK